MNDAFRSRDLLNLLVRSMLEWFKSTNSEVKLTQYTGLRQEPVSARLMESLWKRMSQSGYC